MIGPASLSPPAIVAALVFLAGCSADPGNEGRPAGLGTGYKNAEFMIEGERIKLVDRDAAAAAKSALGPAARTVIRYFGNELKTDLNGDARDDVVFLLTQERGGSGTFFYAVAAVNTASGYVGSDGYLLGDRISPQATVVSSNPRHKNVIVFTFRSRRPEDPMTAPPSIDRKVYLRLDAETVRWGIVAADFEGESK